MSCHATQAKSQLAELRVSIIYKLISTLQKQRWKFHTKIGVFISLHIAPDF